MKPIDVRIGPDYKLVLSEHRFPNGRLALSLRIHDERGGADTARGGFSIATSRLNSLIEALAQAEFALRDEPEMVAR